MKFRVLVSAPYIQPEIDRFQDLFNRHNIEVVLPEVNERMEEEELLRFIGDIDGAICGDDRFTAKVIESAPRLKVISKWGTGIDSIDQEACRKQGIQICNTPNAFSEPVADSVLGYMICFSRKLPWMDREMRKGIWFKIPGRALRESTLGIVGVGDVGKTVARRAIGFGMRILGTDIVDMPEDFLSQTKIEMISREELLRQADFVSLNCDLNPTSYHLMDEAMFRFMKPSAVLINTARGPIVKEKALVKALKDKLIAGAALDVFEEEPLPPDNPLVHMDNVMLAPHNANSSPEAWERVHINTINNLVAVLNGKDV